MNFKTPLLCIAALIPMLVISCSGKVIHGSGPEKSEQRNINTSGLSGLDISAPVDAEIFLDGQSTVMLKGPSDAVACIRTQIKGSKLVVDVPEGTDLNVSRNIKMEIHMSALKSLEASGAGKIHVASTVQTDKFELDISGAGEIDIARLDATTLDAELSGASDLKIEAGKVDNASYDLSGSGNIKALDVEHRQAKVDISGAADASLHVTEMLDADISGAGSIRYKGQPKIHQDVSGAGRLIPVE
jgi:hypothetical protein